MPLFSLSTVAGLADSCYFPVRGREVHTGSQVANGLSCLFLRNTVRFSYFCGVIWGVTAVVSAVKHQGSARIVLVVLCLPRGWIAVGADCRVDSERISGTQCCHGWDGGWI